LQKLLDLGSITSYHFLNWFIPWSSTFKGRMNTFVILLKQSRCRVKLYELHIDPKCKFKDEASFWLESMMGCLCFLLNPPPLTMINVLQNSMVTLF
jgi:hypothetical protein